MAIPAERLRHLVDRRGAVRNRDVVEALRVSPATAHRLLQALVLGGVLERHGKGRAAAYRLRGVKRRYRREGLDEHRVWAEIGAEIGRIRPLDADAGRSLAYAVSEIVKLFWSAPTLNTSPVTRLGGASVATRNARATSLT